MNRIFTLYVVLLFFSCSNQANKSTVQKDVPRYYHQWKNDRIENLTAPFGWLSIVQLIWFKNEILTIGNQDEHDIKIKSDNVSSLGSFELKGDNILFLNSESNPFYNNDKIMDSMNIPTGENYKKESISYNSFQINTIKRGSKIGLRIRDSLSLKRKNFKGINYFDYNPEFMFTAKITYPDKNEMLSFSNKLDQQLSEPILAKLTFEYNQQSHTLSVTDAGDGNWFVVFGDLTNGVSTYGGGRFLYIKNQKGKPEVNLDFNLAENPPCYFTDFATCPLPSKANTFNIEILAGEKADQH